MLGNRGAERLLKARLGSQLQVGAPDDHLEREAERISRAVMAMPPSTVATAQTVAPGEAPLGVQRMCAECRKAAEARAASPAEGPAEPQSDCGCHAAQASGTVEQAQKSPGRPLSSGVRAFFEPRFGYDFSHVRVHADAPAGHATEALGARAFTLGHHIHFGAGEYSPSTEGGRELLAHELVHVVQQASGAQRRRDGDGPPPVRRLAIRGRARGLQRRVINTHVSCRNTGLHGGVPGGVLTGADAISTIRAADARAIDLARRAENLLFLQRLTFGTGAYTADPVFDAALTNRFGLALANPADHRVIAILEREFQAVADFLQSGSIFYVCRDAGCSAGDWAFVFSGEHTIRLCNPFWNSGNVDHQGATLMHEAMHLWWDQIEDRGHRPLHNAHCFEQFALDLAGVAVMPGFAGACVV